MQQKVKLTVFTPAYNRAHTLGRCYESMLKQKCKDFKWLIIDDGSTDNTKELVDSWLNKDNGFEIIYKYKKNGGKGDKKLVYRTSVMKQYPPYPVFEGERYVSLGYKYLLCDQDYKLLVLNDVLCDVEYQLDGSSYNMLRQYYNNPKGFAFIRKIDMRYNKTWKENLKTCIHYVSSSLIAHNKHFIKESPKKGMTILAIPAGILLTGYIKHNVRK